jgi:hypothetical protein
MIAVVTPGGNCSPADRPDAAAANLAGCRVAMTELSRNAELVLDSLETQPALNTPALIAQNEGIERADAEQGLDELLALGRVKKRPTGWKLVRD